MAKDYARRNSQQHKPKVPAWVWLFTGGVLGAFIMFLMHLSKVEDAPPSELPIVGETSTDNIEKLEKPESPFSFPQLLRNAEVKVPEGNSDQNGTQAPQTAFEYSLQVASFKDMRDAEALRAELILLNMDASIEAANVRDNETWHRVIVGPFTSRSKLSKARSTLISNNYSAQVRKRDISG